MKYPILLSFSIDLFTLFKTTGQPVINTENIFIVTIDGVRWQEIVSAKVDLKTDAVFLNPKLYGGFNAIFKISGKTIFS